MVRRRAFTQAVTEAIRSSCPPERTRAMDAGLLAVRLTAGGLLAGHGAQKLFGAFGGNGLEGTAGWLESIGLQPGKTWATLAGLSEFGGGALMALGLGGPVGPIAVQGAMVNAARQVHWNKPIWSAEGGAELPALYAATGIALALTGPGRYSLDRAFGLRVPFAVAALAAAGVAAGIALTEAKTAAAQAAAISADNATGEAAKGGEDRVVAGSTATAGKPGDASERGTPPLAGGTDSDPEPPEPDELTDLVP